MKETRPLEVRLSCAATLDTPISEQLCAEVERHAHGGVERIEIALTTPGGNVKSTLAVAEKLVGLAPKIVTRATGPVASMGVPLYVAADRRLAHQEATFLIHPLRAPAAAHWPTTLEWLDLEDLRKLRMVLEKTRSSILAEVDFAICIVERQEREVRTFLARRTKLTEPAIEALVAQAEWMNAERARAVGIVHEIVA